MASGVNRGSTSRGQTREQGGDRDARDTCVGAQGSFGSRRLPGAIGNGGGDWNASRRMSLRLAVWLQPESVMENSPSLFRPSSPLPLMQGISARKTRVSYSGRRPSINGAANTQVEVKASKLPDSDDAQ